MIVDDEHPDRFHFALLAPQPLSVGRFAEGAGGLAGNRKSHGNRRSDSLNSTGLQFPSDGMGAFSHAQNPERPVRGFLAFLYSSSIVADGKHEFAGFDTHHDVYLGGLGMPEDIGQGLLENAEDD